jgi:hypothetical protein
MTRYLVKNRLNDFKIEYFNRFSLFLKSILKIDFANDFKINLDKYYD